MSDGGAGDALAEASGVRREAGALRARVADDALGRFRRELPDLRPASTRSSR